MKTVVLVHGWNVRDGGAKTVDTLESYLVKNGWTVDKDSADYGFIFWRMLSFLGRWFKTKGIVKRLVPAMEKADLIITHSNGANFANRALKLLEIKHINTKIVVHISPALNKCTKIPPAVKAQLVLHTRWDSAVNLAKWIPFSRWGNMGAVGYAGTDQRNTNIDRTNKVFSHSGHFYSRPMQFITAKLAMTFYEENST